MDANELECTTKIPAEESIHQTIDLPEKKTADVGENSTDKDPAEELLTVQEVTSTTQKEPIEILNVEFVTSAKELENAENNKDMSMDCVSEPECPLKNAMNLEQESLIKENTSLETEEKETPKEDTMESDLAANELVETQENEKNKKIEINETEETTTKASESSKATSSGLGLLAQYDSDNDDTISDSDSVIEVPISSNQDYRNQVVEIDSDSDSDESSSSDVEYLNELRKTIEKRMEVVDEDDDEEGNEDNNGRKRNTPRLKVKGEMSLDDLPPIQDLQITVPEDECIEFGKIHSVVDQLVLVSALPNAILLDLETVIFLEKGQKVLGEVFDVLGQVADPLYCVRFNSNQQIKEKEINVGEVVYVAPKTQYTQYVILSSLMKVKGSDASWENDVEPPPRFLDYSDDEQEQLARRQMRNKDRPVDNDDPTKRARTEDNEDNNSNRHQSPNVQGRNRYNEQRNNRGGSGGNYNSNNRNRNYNQSNGPHQNQQRYPNPNHHRSSWHSNYYPQNFNPQSNVNYGMSQNQQPPSQAYPSHVPMYGMPHVHNMPYPPPHQNPQYGAPPMLHQQMPNAFSIRPPSLHGPPPSHHQQYTSPPPPGSQ